VHGVLDAVLELRGSTVISELRHIRGSQIFFVKRKLYFLLVLPEISLDFFDWFLRQTLEESILGLFLLQRNSVLFFRGY